MSVVVGFYCEVISCELARRSVRRVASAAAAKSSTCGRGGWTSIFDVGHYFPCFNYLTYSVASRYCLLRIITFESVMKTRFNVFLVFFSNVRSNEATVEVDRTAFGC